MTVPIANKSIHELRGIAQGYGVSGNIFGMTANELLQAIDGKQKELTPKPVINIPPPEYDGRLRHSPPSESSDESEIKELLKPYTDIGMRLAFPYPETFHISWNNREDTGNIKQPLRIILQCAQQLMK
jgi:hypothetical protein